MMGSNFSRAVGSSPAVPKAAKTSKSLRSAYLCFWPKNAGCFAAALNEQYSILA
jgi:hypothetical protein